MKVQLINIIPPVNSETAPKILRVMVAGERNGQVLSSMKNVRIFANVDKIV